MTVFGFPGILFFIFSVTSALLTFTKPLVQAQDLRSWIRQQHGPHRVSGSSQKSEHLRGFLRSTPEHLTLTLNTLSVLLLFHHDC